MYTEGVKTYICKETGFNIPVVGDGCSALLCNAQYCVRYPDYRAPAVEVTAKTEEKDSEEKVVVKCYQWGKPQ